MQVFAAISFISFNLSSKSDPCNNRSQIYHVSTMDQFFLWYFTSCKNLLLFWNPLVSFPTLHIEKFPIPGLIYVDGVPHSFIFIIF